MIHYHYLKHELGHQFVNLIHRLVVLHIRTVLEIQLNKEAKRVNIIMVFHDKKIKSIYTYQP